MFVHVSDLNVIFLASPEAKVKITLALLLSYSLTLSLSYSLTLSLSYSTAQPFLYTIPSKCYIFSGQGTIISISAMLLGVYKILSMKQEFTQLQLTRLVYGETTKAESDMLLELAQTVPQIAKTLETLKKGKEALGKDRFSPSEMVINRILGYSASSAPVSAS